MTRNHTHTHTVHSRRHCLLLNWMRRNMCTGLWAHRIIIRNLSSSILERRKKRKVVFFFPFVLSFFFCFLSTFLVLLLLLFLWRRIPVNGAIKSLISRPAYRALQAFLFVLFWNSYLKTKSYSPYFVRVLGFFSPPFFFRSRYLWWYTVFVCSRGSVWTGQHHIDIHNLMLTWGSASPVVSALEPNFLLCFFPLLDFSSETNPSPPSSHQTGAGVIKLVADFLLPPLFLFSFCSVLLGWKCNGGFFLLPICNVTSCWGLLPFFSFLFVPSCFLSSPFSLDASRL